MSSSYRAAGVDIDAGTRAVELMKAAVRATYGPEVLAGIGAFGGLFDISALKTMDAPALVASTDGVGTKTKIAAAMGNFETIGYDIVNHCLNDILVQGARPLFFLDYIAAGRLDPDMVATIVSGCAAACQAAGCALLGGETAEMPGVYESGEFDLVGTIVGVVDRAHIIDGQTIGPGDCLIGLASSGLHTNGFSLARHALRGYDLHTVEPALGQSIGEALLAPHRPYLADVQRLWAADIAIKGMAHITGGGLIDNVPRILPTGSAARIDRESWRVPPLFQFIQQTGRIDEAEMYRVFNMGLGLIVVIPAAQAAQALKALGDEAHLVGEVVSTNEGPTVQIV
jgi:phosphoribosylformylglycinamidine cyclo-ligase